MPPTSLGRVIGRAQDYPHLSEEYQRHLESPAWRATRRAVLVRDGHACTRCGRTDILEVHHLTYARLGHELLSDLTTLCPDCHEAADRARRATAPEERRRRRAVARRMGR